MHCYPAWGGSGTAGTNAGKRGWVRNKPPLEKPVVHMLLGDSTALKLWDRNLYHSICWLFFLGAELPVPFSLHCNFIIVSNIQLRVFREDSSASVLNLLSHWLFFFGGASNCLVPVHECIVLLYFFCAAAAGYNSVPLRFVKRTIRCPLGFGFCWNQSFILVCWCYI